MDERPVYDDPGPDDAAEARLRRALDLLPPRFRGVVERILARWLGRTMVRGIGAFVRVEVFDRAMAIAAQFFSSVLPILILVATWAEVADLVGIPDSSRSVIDEAVKGADSAAFGIIGIFLVLASATSLSRALTRLFAVIWQIPRPRHGLRSAWRWLAVVIVLAMSVIVGHSLTERARLMPPPEIWPAVLSFLADVAVAVFVPWVLLAGRLAVRLLLPGATLFALVMWGVRPASEAWLPRALEASADRYGPIGLAFTYLAWLYAVSFIFVTAAVLGQVLATDRGRLGTWVRGRDDSGPPAHDPDPASSDS